MVHQMDRQFAPHRRIKRGHDIHLLDLIRVRFCPFIILSCRVICRIDFCIYFFQFFRIIRPIAVTDGVSSPPFHQFQCLRHNVQICRYCYSSARGLFHSLLPPCLFYISIILHNVSPVNFHFAVIFIILAKFNISDNNSH